MPYKSGFYIKMVLLVIIIAVIPLLCSAQHFLNKTVTVEIKRKPLPEALKLIGDQGGFYFSYNTNLVKQDSIVSIYARGKTVREVLDMLFDNKYEYKEKGNYIIIQTAPEHWYIGGYIVDGITGDKIPNVSVYEKQQLVSTLTNEDGYFRLRLKDRSVPAIVTINRSWYADTSFVVRAETNNDVDLHLSIIPRNFQLDTLVVTQYTSIEKTWWGKLLLSSRQRVQGLNIDKFFVDVPYQTSLIPGLSTHGNMSSQVVNKISVNVLGGYSGGTNGVEFGGLFNMVRKDVKYVQGAGLFNNVGGKVTGVQMAGLFNNVLDTIEACQLAGLSNTVKGRVTGVQLAGIMNFTGKDMRGVQFAGISNYVNEETDGAQVSGIINIARKNIKGVQVAGIVNVGMAKVEGSQIAAIINIAKQLEGTQVALFNIADSSSGYSLGLLSLIRKGGYHKISLSANEVLNTNIAVKIGTKALYSIFLAGTNLGAEKVYSFGYGYGSVLRVWKGLALNPELTCQQLYLGDWQHTNLLSRFNINVNYRINRYIALYAGPTLNAYFSQQDVLNEGFKHNIPGISYDVARYTPTLTSWVGWNVGITVL